MRLTQSLQSRLFLVASAWILVALAVTGIVLSLLFRHHLEAQVRRQLEDDLIQLLGRVEVSPRGRLVLQQGLSDPLYEHPFSGRYWQVSSAGEVLLRSRSLWDQALSVDLQAVATEPLTRRLPGPRGTPLLMVTRTVTLPGYPQPVRFSATTDVHRIRAAVGDFNTALILALGVLALGLVLAVGAQVRLGLLPLRRLRAALAEVRGGAASRVDGCFPHEVRPLVEDLNGVLALNHALIERARSQAGNLAHALKTPLSILFNDADALHRHGETRTADSVRLQAEAMRHQIDWHLARTRIAASHRPGLRTSVAPVLQTLRRTLLRLHAGRALSVELNIAEEAAFHGEREDLEQMCGNLLDNACKWAAGRVRVAAWLAGGQLHLRCEDDGPGLSPAQRAGALARGGRLDERVPGSGLGLDIVRDLAELYGGALRLETAALGGLAACLVLPAAPA